MAANVAIAADYNQLSDRLLLVKSKKVVLSTMSHLEIWEHLGRTAVRSLG
ncbi:MAG: hypothetical protein WBA43_24675 [Elainellaceae cyanobacterium]